MKVLFITPYYYPNLKGGSERSIKILAEGLAEKGVDVNVLSFDGNSKKIRKERFFGVNVIRVNRPKWKPNTLALNIALLKYKHLVEQQNPDIIHVYNTWQIPAAYFLRKYAPVVATLNNYFPLCATGYTKDNIIERGESSFFKLFNGIFITFEGNFIKRAFAALMYAAYTKLTMPLSKRIDAFIVYSDAVGRIYQRNGFERRKFHTISSLFNFKKRNKKVFKRDRKTVLYVGGPYEAKGFYELLDAAGLVKNKEIKFKFVGVREIPKKAIEIVKKNTLNVEFHKPVSQKELEHYYLHSNVLVHPSLWPEPFSRVWLEALHYDMPIISSDNPVALDILKGGAIFYRRGHPEELADRVDNVVAGKIKINSKYAKMRVFLKKPIEDSIKLYKLLKAGR